MKKLLAGSLAVVLAMTTFNSSAQVIFSENFDLGIPGTWTTIDNDGLPVNATVAAHAAAAWIGIDNPDDPGVGDTVACSTSWYDPAGTSDDWLATPAIALTTGNVLSWDVKAQDPNYPDGYEVMISTTTPTIAGFTANAPLYTIPAAAGVWESQTVDLAAAGYSNQPVFLAWHNFSTDMFLLLVNNVVVQASIPDDVATSNTTFSQYTSTPIAQVGSVMPSALMTNISTNVAHNPTMSFDILLGGSSVFTGSGTQDSLVGLAMDTFMSTTGFTPSALGSYQLIVSASMDELDDDLSNNNDTASFIVSTNMYARDNGTFDNSLGINGFDGFLGQDFEIFSNTTLSEVQFYLETAIIGDEISVEVFDQVGGIPTSSIASSDPYTITAADTGGAWITLPVTQGNLALSEGTYTIGVNQLSTNNYGLALDTQLPFSGVWGSIAGGAFATLESFGFPGTFLIRAILCDASTPSITGFSNTGAQGTTVSWDPQSLPESGGFVIRYHEFGNSPNFSWQLVPNENQTSAYVGGLNDNTRYVFRVGSKCSMSQNATYSDTSSVWTRNQCAKPIGLESSSLGPESQVLDWQQPDADSYKVRFRPVGGSWGYRNINTGANTVTLSGLTPSTNYEWHVRSICNDGGNRPYAALQSFTTPSLRLAASATTIGIYPNPTNGELTVEYHVEESTQASLQILEVNGRVVSNASVTAQEGQNRERLDLDDLAPGFYLLRLVDVNGAVLMNERISKN